MPMPTASACQLNVSRPSAKISSAMDDITDPLASQSPRTPTSSAVCDLTDCERSYCRHRRQLVHLGGLGVRNILPALGRNKIAPTKKECKEMTKRPMRENELNYPSSATRPLHNEIGGNGRGSYHTVGSRRTPSPRKNLRARRKAVLNKDISHSCVNRHSIARDPREEMLLTETYPPLAEDSKYGCNHHIESTSEPNFLSEVKLEARDVNERHTTPAIANSSVPSVAQQRHTADVVSTSVMDEMRSSLQICDRKDPINEVRNAIPSLSSSETTVLHSPSRNIKSSEQKNNSKSTKSSPNWTSDNANNLSSLKDCKIWDAGRNNSIGECYEYGHFNPNTTESTSNNLGDCKSSHERHSYRVNTFDVHATRESLMKRLNATRNLNSDGLAYSCCGRGGERWNEWLLIGSKTNDSKEEHHVQVMQPNRHQRKDIRTKHINDSRSERQNNLHRSTRKTTKKLNASLRSSLQECLLDMGFDIDETCKATCFRDAPRVVSWLGENERKKPSNVSLDRSSGDDGRHGGDAEDVLDNFGDDAHQIDSIQQHDHYVSSLLSHSFLRRSREAEKLSQSLSSMGFSKRRVRNTLKKFCESGINDAENYISEMLENAALEDNAVDESRGNGQDSTADNSFQHSANNVSNSSSRKESAALRNFFRQSDVDMLVEGMRGNDISTTNLPRISFSSSLASSILTSLSQMGFKRDQISTAILDLEKTGAENVDTDRVLSLLLGDVNWIN